MILGGAIGNLYDRIIYNAVPDFDDAPVVSDNSAPAEMPF